MSRSLGAPNLRATTMVASTIATRSAAWSGFIFILSAIFANFRLMLFTILGSSRLVLVTVLALFLLLFVETADAILTNDVAIGFDLGLMQCAIGIELVRPNTIFVP